MEKIVLRLFIKLKLSGIIYKEKRIFMTLFKKKILIVINYGVYYYRMKCIYHCKEHLKFIC